MRAFFRNASPLRHKSDEQIERCLKTKYIFIFTHNIKINCVARASLKVAVRIMLESSAKLPFERKETWKTWHIHYTHTFVTIFSHISSHYLAVRFNEIKNISSIGSIVSCFELSASISFHNIYVCFQQPFCAIHWQLIITHRAN